MLQYEKIDVSEGIDPNKTTAPKEWMLCYDCYFKDVGFRFEPHVCNKCHDTLITAYELKNIAMLDVAMSILSIFYRVLVEMKLLIGWIILC